MRPEIAEALNAHGIRPADFEQAKEDVLGLETARKSVVQLEVAYRKKLISEGGKCAKCPRTDMLTTEHVIPKVLLYDFGVDADRVFWPENLTLLCRPCNALKSGHLDFALPQTKALLTKLLARL